MIKKFIKVNFIILVIFFNLMGKSLAENQQNSDKVIELEEQRQELQEQNQVRQEQLQFVSEELSETVVEIAELTQNILNKQTEIEELEGKAEILSQRIEKVEQELECATKEYNTEKDLLEKRLVAMYEMGETSYLDLILNSKGISDFLSNYYYISEIAATDSELLDLVKEQKDRIENLMIHLQDNERDLSQARDGAEKASIALSNMVMIRNQRLENLSAEELQLQQQVEEYQAQMQEIESEIRLLTIASDNSEYVGGNFAWPVPGYTRISSPFGMRTHPITGVYKLHTGTDISAPMGTSFIASNDGIVTKAGFNYAYGNMVIIDHGGGVSSLYAHGSEILVEVGQVVTQRNSCFKSRLNRLLNRSTCTF